MPELIYMKSHILSAICIAKRLKDMDNVIRELEAAHAAICVRQQDEIKAFNDEVVADNVLVLSSYRLTKRWMNKTLG